MTNHNERIPSRSGRPTPSEEGPIDVHATRKIPLGDVDDLYAYVRKIARPLARDEADLQELIDQGILLAAERYMRLAPGESLKQALNTWLEFRLRDHRRKQHPEVRRNSRAATSYTLQTPTGLAWEHLDTTAGMPAADDDATVESRLRLRLFKRKEDLYNPRLIGRYRRVPSAAGLATAAAAEVWATIEEERALTESKPFRFLKLDELE
jgi:DNA-directed RNA polymerase specialized sigma24 family protein